MESSITDSASTRHCSESLVAFLTCRRAVSSCGRGFSGRHKEHSRTAHRCLCFRCSRTCGAHESPVRMVQRVCRMEAHQLDQAGWRRPGWAGDSALGTAPGCHRHGCDRRQAGPAARGGRCSRMRWRRRRHRGVHRGQHLLLLVVVLSLLPCLAGRRAAVAAA